MKKIILILSLLMSVTSFAADKSIKPLFKDGLIKNLDGSTASYDFLKNNRNAFYVWASWCPYCKANSAKLLENVAKFKNCSNVGIALITVDKSVEAAQKAITEWGYSGLNILSDVTGSTKQMAAGVPKLIITDKEGDVISVHLGGPEIQVGWDNLKKDAEANRDCK